MSSQQVRQISNLLTVNRLPRNKPWQGRPIAVSVPGVAVELQGGMRITILSPEGSDLMRLADYWTRDGVHRPVPPPSDSDDEVRVNPRVAGSASRKSSTRRGAPDVDRLANTPFVEDRSVPNAASIAFLAELHGKSLLIGGDAHSEVLQRSIADLLAGRKQERLRVDAFVVPHAGSARNLSRELLELLECERYLFSTDGSVFNHPHRETIARILMYGRPSPDSPLMLVFNYRTPMTEIWADRELQARYRYSAVYPEQDGAGIKVQL